jgi:methylenetetrahydrofolate reductase (NADPH)
MLVGVGPIASARSARWMRDNLFGVSVPDHVIDRLDKAAEPAAEGRRICIELIQGLRETPGVAGVHVMAPRQSMETVAQIIEDSGVRDAAREAAPAAARS